MAIYNKVYIGHVQTINQYAYETSEIVESKVVALKLLGIDKVNHLPKYKPLRRYGEYYKLERVEPISMNGFISDNQINKALKKTGKPEVKCLRR